MGFDTHVGYSVWYAVVFVGMLERHHADPRLRPRDGMPHST
jgi:hypothetical protein